MCAPVAALAIAGTALSAIGTGVGALQANAQSRYRANVEERNAAMDREAAEQEQANTRETALSHYRQVAGLRGAQRARAAASGVGIEFGTAADLLADTDLLAREDTARIYRQGEQRTRGFEISASNRMAQAGADRSAGRAALVKGAFDIGTTVMGGAQQYQKLRAGS